MQVKSKSTYFTFTFSLLLPNLRHQHLLSHQMRWIFHVFFLYKSIDWLVHCVFLKSLFHRGVVVFWVSFSLLHRRTMMKSTSKWIERSRFVASLNARDSISIFRMLARSTDPKRWRMNWQLRLKKIIMHFCTSSRDFPQIYYFITSATQIIIHLYAPGQTIDSIQSR